MLIDKAENREEITAAFKEREGMEPFPLACFITDRAIPLFFYEGDWYAQVEKDTGEDKFKWVAYSHLKG